MYQMYFTNDGSVGLFSPEADDIYHSSHGALTEAYEKFILPAGVKPAREIKLLDICFGIGYNTKAFLNEVLPGKNIHIDAIDTDKTLAHLSPFIMTGKKKIRQQNFPFVPFELRSKFECKYKLRREVNIILRELLDEADISDLLKEYSPFMDSYMVNLHLGTFLHNIYYEYIMEHDTAAIYLLWFFLPRFENYVVVVSLIINLFFC